MIDKVRDERTETTMKRIHSAMEESKKQILETIKRQRTSVDTERTNKSVQTMSLTLQVMRKGNLTRKKLLPV